MNPKVLCIITTYNRIEYLQQCMDQVVGAALSAVQKLINRSL